MPSAVAQTFGRGARSLQRTHESEAERITAGIWLRDRQMGLAERPTPRVWAICAIVSFPHDPVATAAATPLGRDHRWLMPPVPKRARTAHRGSGGLVPCVSSSLRVRSKPVG